MDMKEEGDWEEAITISDRNSTTQWKSKSQTPRRERRKGGEWEAIMYMRMSKDGGKRDPET